MRHYVGERTPEGCTVEVIDRDNANGGYQLNARFDLANKSPTGFEFGYSGSGPAQLALDLLADALGDDERALRHYQKFKVKVIAPLEGDSWEMSQEDIVQPVGDIERDSPRESTSVREMMLKGRLRV